MPSSMTHTYFGVQVYNKLPIKYKNKIKNSLEFLKLFSQGPDAFMFYKFKVVNNNAATVKLQSDMHNFKTRDYFMAVINYINDNDLSNDEQVMAYLYGFIAHYYLDSYAHPYINYKGGKFDNKNKNTYKYSGVHQEIEFMIDMYYIDKYENVSHKKFKTYKHIFNVNNYSSTLFNLIDTTIDDVYGFKNGAKVFFNGSKCMKWFFRIFNYDPYGIKLWFYHIIDKIMPWYVVKVSELSFYNEVKVEYLNFDRKRWNMPWDKKEISDESFQDIFDRALRDSIDTIIKVTDMLDKRDINKKRLEEIFGDWSYSTGRDSSLNLVSKYFEY